MILRFNAISVFYFLIAVFCSFVLIPDILVAQRKTQIYFGSSFQHFPNNKKNVAGEFFDYILKSDSILISNLYEGTYDLKVDFKNTIGYDFGIMNQIGIKKKYYIAYGSYLSYYKLRFKNEISNYSRGNLISSDTLNGFSSNFVSNDSTVIIGGFPEIDPYNRFKQYSIKFPVEFGYKWTNKFELFGNIAIGFIINQKQLRTEAHKKETKIIDGRKTTFVEIQQNYRTTYNYRLPNASLAFGGRYKLFKYCYINGSLSFDVVNLFKSDNATYVNGLSFGPVDLNAIKFKPIGLHLGLSTMF
jgi:hypothetical protein